MRAAGIAAGLVAVAALGAAAYYFWLREPPPPPRGQTPAVVPPPAAGPRHPLPAPEPAPLPKLGESDAVAIDALASLLKMETVRRLIRAEDLVRHIVATVDNLPRESVAARVNPIIAPGGLPKTTGRGDALALAPDNAARYTPYVVALEGVNSANLAALYVRFYPLFQEAYVELGYPTGYFNDRLIEVIDHLLETPEIAGPIRLTTPHVLYEYADPALQERSVGQKALIRMGRENGARVKAKLRELRAELLAQAPKK